MTELGGGLRECVTALTEQYDVALLDLDGVVYLGEEPIGTAVDALAQARVAGMRMCFTTNNASKRPEEVATRLSRMGVPAAAADVVTSSQAAARLLADELPAASPVLIVGTQALAEAVTAVGLTPVQSASDQPRAVVQGYDAHLTYSRLAEAALAIRAGARWVATNADATLPAPRGLLPGNGAMVAAVATATGATPVVAGKPERPLHAEAVRRSGARRPLVVGDRLDTDIVGAIRGGADSLLVLTGVTSVDQLLAAAPGTRPSYVAPDLRGLLHPQADAARTSDHDEVATVIADLRARCAAAWGAGSLRQ